MVPFLGAIVAGIGAAVSAATSVVTSVAAAVGPAISTLATGAIEVIGRLAPSLDKMIEVVSLTSNIIHEVVGILGIQSVEDPEILGAKVREAEQRGVGIDDFDDVEAYIDYLNKQIELDMEEFDKLTVEEKLGWKAVGTAIEIKAVSEKVGIDDISPNCIGILAKLVENGININPEKLAELVQFLKEHSITNMDDVVEFLEGKGNSDRLRTGEVIEKFLGDESIDKILEVQDIVRRYEEGV